MTRRYLLSGRVQGVGFRFFTQRAATQLGVVGWVRNCPDGAVEAVAQGSEEALQAFRQHLQQGPSWSEVRRIEETRAEPGTFTAFNIEM
ncbi:MAG: acylphosphatase [Acidobacteriota bacterium]